MNYVLVYGSLRKGEYNYDRFQQYYPNQIQYLETFTVKGFDLYSLGPYPAIIPGKGELVVDLLLVSDAAKEGMDDMELGAGYIIETIELDNKDADIYIYNNTDYIKNNCHQIKSGDWLKREYNEVG